MRKGIYQHIHKEKIQEDSDLSSFFSGMYIASSIFSFTISTLLLTVILTPICHPLLYQVLYEGRVLLLIIAVMTYLNYQIKQWP